MPGNKLKKAAKKNAKKALKAEVKAVMSGHGKYKAAMPKKVKGHGGYSLGDIVSAVAKPFMHNESGKSSVNQAARTLGSALGGATGIPGLGTALGNAASWFSKVVGFGNYATSLPDVSDMNQNSLIGIIDKSSGFTTNATAKFSGPHAAALRFQHREYVGPVTSSVAFVNTPYFINPGNPQLFPWGWRIASCYEKYKLHGVIFEYVSTSGTAQASTLGVGTITTATDYDLYDTGFPNRIVMNQQQFSMSHAPYESHCYPVECAYAENQFNVFTVAPGVTTVAGLAGLGDYQKFGPGIFQIATQGQPAAGQGIGDLYISYDIELMWPTAEFANGSTTFTQHIFGSINTSGVMTVSDFHTSTGAVFGQSSTWGGGYFTMDTNSSVGNIKLAPSNGILTPGSYMAQIWCRQTAGTTMSNGTAPFVSGTAQNLARMGASIGNENIAATSWTAVPLGTAGVITQNGTTAQASMFFTLVDTSGIVSLPGTWNATAGSEFEVWIFGLGSSATSNPIQSERQLTKSVDDLAARFSKLEQLEAVHARRAAELDEVLGGMLGETSDIADHDLPSLGRDEHWRTGEQDEFILRALARRRRRAGPGPSITAGLQATANQVAIASARAEFPEKTILTAGYARVMQELAADIADGRDAESAASSVAQSPVVVPTPLASSSSSTSSGQVKAEVPLPSNKEEAARMFTGLKAYLQR